MSEAQLMLIGHRCIADEPLLQIAHKKGELCCSRYPNMLFMILKQRRDFVSRSHCVPTAVNDRTARKGLSHIVKMQKKQEGPARPCKDKLSILSEVYSRCFIQRLIISSESYISLSLSRAVPRCLMESFVFRRPNV